MSNIQNLLENRRTIYQLGRNVSLSQDKIVELVQNAVRQAPSAFNSQSSRVVVLFDEAHNKLWNITEEELKKIVPADAFASTKARIDGFKAAYGTILYFEDQNVVKGLQEQFALYAENFPKWSQESTALAQYAVWLALTEAGLGANIQHYNPLINAEVHKEWNLPESWALLGQMPFGSIVAKADAKPFMDDQERFKVFK